MLLQLFTLLCQDLIFLQKYLSITENTDFQRAYHRGRSCARPALVVYSNKNRVGVCRVGITTSKKIGNAVERNQLPTSADFVISMMWTTVFMGSVTSMIMAPLVRLVAKKRFNENNENQ